MKISAKITLLELGLELFFILQKNNKVNLQSVLLLRSAKGLGLNSLYVTRL